MTHYTVIDSPEDFPVFNWRWWEWVFLYGIGVVFIGIPLAARLWLR